MDPRKNTGSPKHSFGGLNAFKSKASLMSHCLQKGENIALVLKDVGVLVIEGTRVQMKFYYDFLERFSGKENLEEAIFKVRAWSSSG